MEYQKKKFNVYMGCDTEQARKNYDKVFGKKYINLQKLYRIIIAIITLILTVLILTWR